MYDFIIIGAGVSGAFIAMELAKYNLKIFGLANDINNNNISTKITIIEIA